MNEQLSGWLDGEADDLSSERVLRSLKDDPAAFDDARISLLIGDALRNEMALDMAFMALFSDALRRVPAVLAASAVARPDHSHRRFVAFSAAASVAVFSVLGWFAFSTGYLAGPPAAPNGLVAVAVTKPRVAHNVNMQEYMAVHQELSSYQAVAFNTAGQ